MNDSIIHTFYNCNWSQLFFAEVIKWFNKENAASLTLSPTELILGKHKDNVDKELDIIIRKLNFTFYMRNIISAIRSLCMASYEFIGNVKFIYNFEKF